MVRAKQIWQLHTIVIKRDVHKISCLHPSGVSSITAIGLLRPKKSKVTFAARPVASTHGRGKGREFMEGKADQLRPS